MILRPFNSPSIAMTGRPLLARQSYKRRSPFSAKLRALCDPCAHLAPRQHNPPAGALPRPPPVQTYHSCPDSVHWLCKPCNQDLNARHPARPASPPTAVAPPPARSALAAVRARPFAAASAGFTDSLQAVSGDSPSPRPAPVASRRRRAPRPRPSGEGLPRTPPRASHPVFGPCHAPDSAKMHPAAPSVMPATAGIHPYHPRAPNLAKKRPAATEEFFRKNS